MGVNLQMGHLYGTYCQGSGNIMEERTERLYEPETGGGHLDTAELKAVMVACTRLSLLTL